MFAPVPPANQQESIALSFTPAETAAVPQPPQVSEAKIARPNLTTWIYEGGSDSLVARVIGSAEGTRTASGDHTKAYYGHTDPGNGVWNMGTFSYQHGARTPQEADKKQLRRLEKQGNKLTKQAEKADLNLSLGELLNGLDLANQAPRAALDRGGYVDRLAEARESGMKNSEAIVWARTYSYMNPDTQRWEAPGLGNTLPSIRRDQHRRYDAVDRAFSYYQAQREKNGEPPVETLETPAFEIAQSSEESLIEVKRPEKIPAQPAQAAIEFNIADFSGSTVENDNKPLPMFTAIRE